MACVDGGVESRGWRAFVLVRVGGEEVKVGPWVCVFVVAGGGERGVVYFDRNVEKFEIRDRDSAGEFKDRMEGLDQGGVCMCVDVCA